LVLLSSGREKQALDPMSQFTISFIIQRFLFCISQMKGNIVWQAFNLTEYDLSELSPIQTYIDECWRINSEQKPALWEVSRAGHNWVTFEERINALLNLIEWIRYGTFITARNKNTTIESPDPPRTAEFVSGEGGREEVICQVTSINIHGDPRISLTRADLDQLGIRLGDQVKFSVEQNKEEKDSIAAEPLIATLDEYPYVRAAPDTWVIMLDPSQYVCIWKRSWKYRNTAQLLNLQKGSKVRFWSAKNFKSKKAH
jgi:hypothetical protein